MSDWTPIPFPTQTPSPIPVLNKSVSDNPYMALGLSAILISLVLGSITILQYTKNILNIHTEIHTKPFWISLLIILFLYGLTLMSVEGTAETLDSLKLARANEQIVFGIFFFIVICLFGNAMYFRSKQTIGLNVIVFTGCLGALIACMVSIGNFSQDTNLEDPQLLTGSIIILLIGFAILITSLWFLIYENISNNYALSLGIVVSLLGFILTCYAASLTKQPPKGQLIPQSIFPVYPKDIVCKNITRTIYPATWTNISRLRFIFTVNYLTYGSPSTPFAPMDLISVKDAKDNQVLLIRYADKKLFFRANNTELSLDVVPREVAASIVFVTYEDENGKKLGTMFVFNEGDPSKTISSNFNGSPADWGLTTIETFKNVANNNADVISGMQLCTEPPKNGFDDIPMIYKIITFGVILLIVFGIIKYILQFSMGSF